MAKITLGTWAWGTGAFGDFPACIFFHADFAEIVSIGNTKNLRYLRAKRIFLCVLFIFTLISQISQKLFPSETLKICVIRVICVHD